MTCRLGNIVTSPPLSSLVNIRVFARKVIKIPSQRIFNAEKRFPPLRTGFHQWIELSRTTVFTCRVDSTGTPDVRISDISNEGGSEEDGNDGFPVKLFKDGTTLEQAKRLSYGIRQAGKLLVQWTALLVKDELFVYVPESSVPERGKECLVSLLDYAELELNCQKVYVCCRKERSDRAEVLRTFAFLGFNVVPPGLSPIENSSVVLMMMPLG